MMDYKWRDRFGLVRPKENVSDTGNGFYYSTVGLAVNAVSMPEIFDSMAACYDSDRKLLKRNPENSYGNTSHDDYLALGMLFIFNGETREPRRLLARAVFRGFYLKNCAFDFNGTWEQFFKQVTAPMLWRFPVWILVMIGAAFPSIIVRYPVRKLLRLILSTYKKDYGNQSGLQLQFMSLYALGTLGEREPMEKFMRELPAGLNTLMSKAGDPYWQPGHPVLTGMKSFHEYILETSE